MKGAEDGGMEKTQSLETFTVQNTDFTLGQDHWCNCVSKHPLPQNKQTNKNPAMLTQLCHNVLLWIRDWLESRRWDGSRGWFVQERWRGWVLGACLDSVLIHPFLWGCWPDTWPAGQEDFLSLIQVFSSTKSGHTAGAQWMLIRWLHFKLGKRVPLSLTNCN